MTFTFGSYTPAPRAPVQTFSFGSTPVAAPGAAEGGNTSMPFPAQEAQQKDSSTTVKFNVGGKPHEIAKSLLNRFPDTKLAEEAKSSSSPIFFDRDPDRFTYCLDYMRDNGHVFLPETVSKLAFLKELEFFGFVDVDETKISDEKSKQNCVVRFHQVSENCKQRIYHLEDEVKSLEERAKALEIERATRKQEIKIEKVVLKCLAKSVERAYEDSFAVDYQSQGLYHLHNEQYFIDRCDKLGLRVDQSSEWTASTRVCLRRNSSAEVQK